MRSIVTATLCLCAAALVNAADVKPGMFDGNADVGVTPKAGSPAARPAVRSKISIYDLKQKSIEVIYTADKLFEAPNWSRSGKFLLVNSGGNLLTLDLGANGPEPRKIDPGSITGCNNDHGISPDGR